MIKDMPFLDQSALFARMSNLSYREPKEANKHFKHMGYKSTYLGNKGSDAFIVEDANDLIVVCRGTETRQWSDIKADLTIALVPSRSGVGKVHRGFHKYVDKLWEPIEAHIKKGRAAKKNLWITGHSLGGAMATLIARRCAVNDELRTPEALFTYGSPRVGNKAYIKSFDNLIVHHRWVNDGDIVTKVPFPPFYYHCGTKHLVSENEKSIILTLIGFVFGWWKGILNILIKNTKDHSSELYVQKLFIRALDNIGEDE
jgi:triacylglycerol lipase